MINQYAPPRSNLGSIQPEGRRWHLAIAALIGAANWPLTVFAVLFADSAVWGLSSDGYPPQLSAPLIFAFSACVAVMTCLVMSLWLKSAWYLQWFCFLLGACCCVLVLAYYQSGSITLGLAILRRHAFMGLTLASLGTLAGMAYVRRNREEIR